MSNTRVLVSAAEAREQQRVVISISLWLVGEISVFVSNWANYAKRDEHCRDCGKLPRTLSLSLYCHLTFFRDLLTEKLIQKTSDDESWASLSSLDVGLIMKMFLDNFHWYPARLRGTSLSIHACKLKRLFCHQRDPHYAAITVNTNLQKVPQKLP